MIRTKTANAQPIKAPKVAPRLPRGKAIKLHCKECMGYDGHRGGNAGTSYNEAAKLVKQCTTYSCTLWWHRASAKDNIIPGGE